MFIGVDPRPHGRASCSNCPAIYQVPIHYCTDMKDVPMTDSCPCGFNPIEYLGCIWDVRPGEKHLITDGRRRRRESPREAGRRVAREMLASIRMEMGLPKKGRS